jgi:hypothetical protein
MRSAIWSAFRCKQDVERAKHRRLDSWREVQRLAALEVEQKREAHRPARIARKQAAIAAKRERAELRLEREVEAEEARCRKARVSWLVRFIGDAREQFRVLFDALDDHERWVKDVLCDVAEDEFADALAVLERRRARDELPRQPAECGEGEGGAGKGDAAMPGKGSAGASQARAVEVTPGLMVVGAKRV